MPGQGTQGHEDRELDWERCVRGAADICALRRSAPTWGAAPSLFSKQQTGAGPQGIMENQPPFGCGISRIHEDEARFVSAAENDLGEYQFARTGRLSQKQTAREPVTAGRRANAHSKECDWTIRRVAHHPMSGGQTRKQLSQEPRGVVSGGQIDFSLESLLDPRAREQLEPDLAAARTSCWRRQHRCRFHPPIPSTSLPSRRFGQRVLRSRSAGPVGKIESQPPQPESGRRLTPGCNTPPPHSRRPPWRSLSKRRAAVPSSPARRPPSRSHRAPRGSHPNSGNAICPPAGHHKD